MASAVSEHVQEVKWSFSVADVFSPKSAKGQTQIVLAGSVLSGDQDQVLGRSVVVMVGGRESGRGRIVSRYRFSGPEKVKSAYVFQGDAPVHADIATGVILKEV